MIFQTNTSLKWVALALLLLPMGYSFAQAPNNFTWWNELHNWDNVTPWYDYMTNSPAHMGPNALPVQRILKGAIPKAVTLELGAETHQGAGDRTQNVYTNFFVPLFSPRVGLNLEWVPYERFSTTMATRNSRKARGFLGQGTSVGDVYVGTFIQLLENKRYLPDVLLRINLKTASGNNLENARFTDAPAYSFDLSLGKTFTTKNTIVKAVRPYALGGLLVWQLHGTGPFQNDAFMYGLGADVEFKYFTITNAFGGYYGYLNNGDRPAVYRLQLLSNLKSKLNYSLTFQQGFVSYPFTSMRFTCLYTFKKAKNQTKPLGRDQG